MLVLLTSKWRRRTAAFMATLFALCLLSPVAAFTFSHGPAHCLTLAEMPQAGPAHDHHHDGDGHAAHSAMAQGDMGHAALASAADDEPAIPGKCCGLFCVSGLTPPAFGVSDMRLVAATEVALPLAEHLLGRTPSGIDRPPRVLPSL